MVISKVSYYVNASMLKNWIAKRVSFNETQTRLSKCHQKFDFTIIFS